MGTGDPVVPPDPGELLRRHAPRPDERKAVIDALLTECATWLRHRCTVPAAAYGLLAEDVFQQTLERLLKASTAVDTANKGLRTWLGKCVDWAALDLLERRRREGGVRLAPEALESALEHCAEASSADPASGDTVVDETFLSRLGLSRNQVQIVLNECSGPDLSLKEFARTVNRSYGAVRKDKERALDQIESWLGLSADEARAFIAFRAAGSVEKAAVRLGVTRSEFRGLLDNAHKKVDMSFTERRVDPDVR